MENIFSLAKTMEAKRMLQTERILEANRARIRAELGEVTTTLTPDVGHTQGLRSFSIREIMYVYGVTRSTANRWKQHDCHPSLTPWVNGVGRIAWTYYKPHREVTCSEHVYDPQLEAIRMARSSVRCAINKLKKLQSDPRFAHGTCTAASRAAARETVDAALDLASLVDDSILDE